MTKILMQLNSKFLTTHHFTMYLERKLFAGSLFHFCIKKAAGFSIKLLFELHIALGKIF